MNAPLQNLIGLIDARIEQLQAQGDTSAASVAEAHVEAVPEAAAEAIADEAAEPAEAPGTRSQPLKLRRLLRPTPAADAEAESPAEVEAEQEIAELEESPRLRQRKPIQTTRRPEDGCS